MSKTNMPAAEALSGAEEKEIFSYELAYHVLPTVAEGEVSEVRDAIAAHITKSGGEVLIEETPQRFDLAYDIVKYVEGRNRKFSSAYFGWIRFQTDPATSVAINEEVGSEKQLLRHLLIRLTKTEEARPFYFHEALAADKKVTTVTEEETDIDPNATTEAVDTSDLADDTEVATTASVETASESEGSTEEKATT